MPEDIGKLRTELESITKSVNDLFSRVTGAGASVDRTSASVSNLRKNLQDAEGIFTDLGAIISSNEEALDALGRVAEQSGMNLNTLADDITEVEDTLREQEAIIENVKNAWDEMAEHLDKNTREEVKQALMEMGVDVRSQMEKIHETVTREAAGAVRGTMGAVQREVGVMLPPGLQRLGIWGLLLGSFIAVEEYMETTAAGVLTQWRAFAPEVTGAVGAAGISGMQEQMRQMWQDQNYQFLVSREQMERLVSGAAPMLGQMGDSLANVTDEAFELVDTTVQLDMIMGQQFGNTLQRTTDLVVNYGANVQDAENQMITISQMFEGRGRQSAAIYAQTVLDLSARLGALGMDVTEVGDLFDTFRDVGEGMNIGLRETTRATEGLVGFFSQLPEPMRALLGRGLEPGATGAGALLAYERAVMSGELTARIPDMLANLSEMADIQGKSVEQVYLLLKGFGMPGGAAALAAEVMAGRTPGEVRAEFAGLSSEEKTQLVEGFGGARDLKNLFEEKVGDFERLLKTFIDVIMKEIEIITEALTALVLMAANIGDVGTMKRIGSIWWDEARGDFKGLSTSVEEMLSLTTQTVPGFGFASRVIQEAGLFPGEDVGGMPLDERVGRMVKMAQVKGLTTEQQTNLQQIFGMVAGRRRGERLEPISQADIAEVVSIVKEGNYLNIKLSGAHFQKIQKELAAEGVFD